MASSSSNDIFQADFVNETHVRAFADALQSDDRHAEHIEASASPVSLSPPSTRIRKVSALSDFAPINVAIPRKRKHKVLKRRHDLMFHIIRWPLLLLLFVYIYGIFGLYVVVRQIVNAIEWMFEWRGQKAVLRSHLRLAKSFEEWKLAAQTMDRYLGFNEWKKEDCDPYYDWALVHKVRRSLRALREKDDARGILGVLETCIRANFAGTESVRLYSQTYYGTKDCIEEYISEVVSALQYVRETSHLQQEEKRRFFKSANRNLGSSALCLSGGASFGYYHLGIARALLDANLIPRVVTGTSAGGLIAALICTRSDEELKQLLVPQLADKITACEEPFRIWFSRLRRTGARFDTVQWARKAPFFTRGSLTFLEAYQLTGRVLNISVIPFDRHSPTKLLNYLTAPNCVIWSALIASAAVPGILNPVVLMQKDKAGNLVPWNWGARFKDGSLRVDIPIQSLNLLFNVTNPVVSQVNPHVHLWHFGPRGSPGKPVPHRKGKGWRGGFILSAAEQWLKLELTKNFKFMRDLELLPTLLGQDWSSVFLQKFEGVVTIWPRSKISDWFHILDDPSRDRLSDMLLVGQRVTWPRIHIIENRAKLEKEILRSRRDLKPKEPLATRRVKSSRDASPIRRPGLSPDISIESEVEAAFTQRTSRPSMSRSRQRTPSPSVSPSTGQSNNTSLDQNDPLYSTDERHQETTTLVVFGATDSQDRGVQSEPRADVPDPSAWSSLPSPQSPSRAAAFLCRLQRRSLASIPSAFSNLRRTESNVLFPRQEREDEAWSSDSSSSDYPVEEGQIRSRHSSIMANSNGVFERKLPEENRRRLTPQNLTA